MYGNHCSFEALSLLAYLSANLLQLIFEYSNLFC